MQGHAPALPMRTVPRIAPVRSVSARRLNALMALSTTILVSGLILAAGAVLMAETTDQCFRYPAPVLAVALGLALTVEGRAGLRNLVRVDLFMLAVLFLLTFFEFLFPQDPIGDRITFDGAQKAALAVLLGFGGIALGRHLSPIRHPLPELAQISVRPRTTILLMLGCAFLGYLYMLLSVRFDIGEMLYQMTRPRFSQPWTRGRLGSLSTLLNEFALLKYLLPPLAAAVFAQGRRYSLLQKAIALAILALVLFEGFAGGTRNVFLTHLVTFAATYALLLRRLTLGRLLVVAVPVLAMAGFATYYLAEIRTVGLQSFDLETARTGTVFIDMNLVNIAVLTEVFPRWSAYLGLEIPVNALIRPIPRAFWPGKPEGLSVSIEEAVGVTGLTLAATFVGELWMAGGFPAVALAAVTFGAIAGRWNRVGQRATDSLRLILFAAGFFPAGICMRSFLQVAPAILPVVAMYIYLGTSKTNYPNRTKKVQGRIHET